MLEYIERKGILGQDGSLAVQKSAAATRTGVELANCVDFARRTRDGRLSFFILIRLTGEIYPLILYRCSVCCPQTGKLLGCLQSSSNKAEEHQDR